ncbi:WSC-domain-containing protein [Polyporus arcularius HHB13444]|uniref:WSC-domain-containing protein n=1 Tax=Polyporus arcularius HHB13444 TaxID=1314778 RepID=A0A5C3Q1C9_9APHY|nr:WSC-domain-containing protein [Polyporus arcularius HHB13444]
MPILARTINSTSSLVLVLLILLTRPALSFSPPPIPLNWTPVLPCASDTPARVLTNVRTHTLANNTPAACIALCDASPGAYTYAGVEYADECHCGTGLAPSPPPQAAPAAECDMPCMGDADLSCGGPWRIQIYKSPALPPGSWSLQGCFLDTPLQPALAAPTHHSFPTNLDLVSQCIAYCQHAGLPWAGVEDAQDCQCSRSGYATGGARRVDEGECNATCPLPPGAGSQYCGGLQRLMVYEYGG